MALTALEDALADGRPYVVAILDSQMPDHDGWTLARDIRAHPRLAKTRLLMLTSAGEKGDAERCRALGIEGYLVKPVARSDLIEAVGLVLAGNGSVGPIVTRHVMAEARTPLRILLAEDNLVNQQVAIAMLRKRGHDVIVVDDGAKAVTAIETGHFDVVLMDIHMPEMDGLEATAKIRTLPGGADLPIVALTADALAGEREHCLAAGMSEYLAKPFKSHDLFAVVEQWGPPPDSPAAPADPAGGNATEPAESVVLAHAGPLPIDVAAFTESMREAGAESAVEEILGTFVAHIPKRGAALTSALASGRAADIRSAAHAFKAASGAVCAHPLAEQLLQVESAAREGRVGDAVRLAEGVPAMSDAVLTYLRERSAAAGR
jgi:CheY-like chemotaxis protein